MNPSRCVFAVAVSAATCLAATAAAAQTAPTPACAIRPIRWQDDCRGLPGADLQGLERLRYLPVAKDGNAWLTFGGEARTRVDLLEDVDFGINGAPGYTELSGRLLLNADLRTAAGPRVFVQLGVMQQDGRYPGPRAQDESAIDATQVLIDLPWEAGQVRGLVRLGRQELDLSGNRLVNARDGSTIRRAFQGVKLDVATGGVRIAFVDARPMDLRDEAFADRADTSERFRALTIDVPVGAGNGLVDAFVLERRRDDARYLRAQGAELRRSFGLRYAGPVSGWRVDAQGTFQTGHVQGKPVRAYGVGFSADRELGGPLGAALGIDFVMASGDKAGTRRIETFDPTYPNNGGLSDAPLFYQTNYVFGGGGVSVRWAGATWAAQSNLVIRHSTTDAVYANGRPIPANFRTARLTSLLSQVSVRRTFGPHYEAYASLVRGDALGSVRTVGGHDALYSRVQLTARF